MTDENRTLRATTRSAAGMELGKLPVDPNVKLPSDVQATIAQGEAAFKNNKKGRRSKRHFAQNSGAAPTLLTAVTDQQVIDRRESILTQTAEELRGKRGQPPMLDRLRVGSIVVDWLQAQGVRFGTGRNSRMNKLFRKWLNGMAANSKDTRKSRSKEISADAVRDTLRKIKGLDD
jgi:hypothetical protein